MITETLAQEPAVCRCGAAFNPWRKGQRKYHTCYDCYLERAAEFDSCIFCGSWHSPKFSTCYRCRQISPDRDEAGKELRQLILWRDNGQCRGCGAIEGDEALNTLRFPPTRVSVTIQIDHIVPCASGGDATEWNLQTLCSQCNRVKGSVWFAGCRYEVVKTRLVEAYWLTARTYFPEPELARFRGQVALWKATGTWDPGTWRSYDPDLYRQHVRDGREAA